VSPFGHNCPEKNMTDAEKIKTLRAAVSNLIEFADMHVLATANIYGTTERAHGLFIASENAKRVMHETEDENE
jgi:hypothetical protein